MGSYADEYRSRKEREELALSMNYGRREREVVKKLVRLADRALTFRRSDYGMVEVHLGGRYACLLDERFEGERGLYARRMQLHALLMGFLLGRGFPL